MQELRIFFTHSTLMLPYAHLESLLHFTEIFKLSFKEKRNGNQMWLRHNRALQQRAKGIKESTYFYCSSKEWGNFMRVPNLRDT
jgi:hypothetical protein